MRILIVDDNYDILALVQRVLQIEGHQVVVAHTGPEGLQREVETQPDLVICDVNLPGLDGWEVCKRMKARRNVPVILLTVRAEGSDIERSYAAGAEDHLLKPFDIGEFLTYIARFEPHRPTTNFTN